MTLNNPGLYDAVIAGIALSNGAWASETNPSDYAPEANAAVAIATEVDAGIAPIVGGSTISQRNSLQSITKATMTGRTPTSLMPSDYSSIASGIIAVFTEFSTKFQDVSTATNNPIVVNGNGAVEGDVIQQTTVTGVFQPALADSTAHANAVVGVYINGLCVPFDQSPIANFVSTPSVGLPCYLSSNVAGKLTTIAPSIVVPLGLVALKDTSSGSNFSAQVTMSGSIQSTLSEDQQFIADAAAEIGVSPNTLHTFSDDYNTLPTTGFPSLGSFDSPINPNPTHLGTSPARSRLTWVGNNGGGNLANWTVSLGTPASPTNLNLLQNTSLANQQWSFRMKFQQGSIGQSLKLWLDKGDGFESVGIGMVAISGSNQFCAMYGNFNPETSDPTAGQRVVLVPEDQVDHIVTMTSIDDGSIRFHFDSLPVIVLPLPASASATIPRLRAIATGLTIDYLQVCAT